MADGNIAVPMPDRPPRLATCCACSGTFSAGLRGPIASRCLPCRTPDRAEVCAWCAGRIGGKLKHAVYCSRTCAGKAWRAANPARVEATRLLEQERRRAERALLPERQSVDRAALAVARAAAHAAAKKARHAGAPCARCHAPVPYAGNGPPRVYCSPSCTKRAGRRAFRSTLKGKARHRADRRAYFARKRGVTVEVFDPIEVLARDGWRCQICGCSTPPHLRGTTEPNAPELDHVVALANGGAHSRANTQCACRLCNSAKADGPALGQRRLL